MTVESDWVAISKKEHVGYGFSLAKPFEFAAGFNFIDVNSAELAKVIGLLPLFFKRVDVEGKSVYRFGMATSLGDQCSLIHPGNGKFLLPYIPASLRAYPFNLAKAPDGESDLLAVLKSEVCNGFAEGNSEPIVGKEGITEKGKSLMTFLSQLRRVSAADSMAINEVVESGVLVPMNIEVAGPDKKDELRVARSDLYRVNEKAFREISKETLQKLQKTGAMAFIYANLFSLDKFGNLQKVIDVHNKLRNQASNAEIDLEDLFDEGDSDVLKF